MAPIKDRPKGLVIKELLPSSAEVHLEPVLEDTKIIKRNRLEEDNNFKVWEVAKETIIRWNQMRAKFNTLFKIASPT